MINEAIETCIHEILEQHGLAGNAELVDDIMRIIPKSSLEQVREFHNTFQHPSFALPVKTNQIEKFLPLRLSLMLEELTEIAVAGGRKVRKEYVDLLYQALITVAKSHSDNWNQVLDYIDIFESRLIDEDQGLENISDVPDMLEILDGLCDLRYVTDGTTVALGLQSIFDDAFTIVHESNMSKVCADEFIANETAAHYTNVGIAVIQEQNPMGKGIIIKRKRDGKVLKSRDYFPATPELKALLHELNQIF